MSLPKLKSRDANGEFDQSGYVSYAKFKGGVETNATHDFYTKMAFTECYDFNKK